MINDLANYVSLLLKFDPALVVIGRENAEKVNSSKNYIVVDELLSVPYATSQAFDGTEEEIKTSINMKGDFTIDFHGVDARKNVVFFLARQSGQRSYELQRDRGISIYHVSSLRDLKLLEGSQYKDRYQVEMKVQYNISETIETRRIDTAQASLLIN